jgi:enamine deaminase RidA (YjgF/YER057c/UK114 family)
LTDTLTPPLRMSGQFDVDETPEQRLVSMGIVLPVAAAPVASYVPTVFAGGLLHVSGQLPFREGQVVTGRAGVDRTAEFAQEAARLCGLMILAQVKAALGSLDRVERVVKLGVFVNSDPKFTAQPKVANGASDLMVDVFGEAGKHARAAVGVAALPLDALVEADAIFAVKPA